MPQGRSEKGPRTSPQEVPSLACLTDFQKENKVPWASPQKGQLSSSFSPDPPAGGASCPHCPNETPRYPKQTPRAGKGRTPQGLKTLGRGCPSLTGLPTVVVPREAAWSRWGPAQSHLEVKARLTTVTGRTKWGGVSSSLKFRPRGVLETPGPDSLGVSRHTNSKCANWGPHYTDPAPETAGPGL